jgi:hypothetical protein
MDAAPELQGVEIEFLVDWYDGPLSGVATYEGQAYWFEAEHDWDPDAELRPLFLYPASAEELAAERELHDFFANEAKGKPVEEWPDVLRERDFDLPTKYGRRQVVGWFAHRL